MYASSALGLGDEACKKGNDFAILFDSKARFPKMDEEYSWQKVRHLTAAPPIVKNRNNRVVVPFFEMSDLPFP